MIYRHGIVHLFSKMLIPAPVVQTTILVIAVSFVAVNLFVDVLYVLINPRIKYV